jgi:purine-binding chemotaxis protein CheW
MTGKIVTFYLQGNLFGLDIASVKEAVRNTSYTLVPGVSSYIAGLMNMRGQTVTLFNINKIMGYDCVLNSPDTSCIILKNRPNRPDYAGFLVEKLGDILDVKDEWCQLPPTSIKGINGRYIRELVKLEDRLVIIIEPEKIISERLPK